MNFAERVKRLKAEVEALKTAKRKSSTTLSTITHAVTCTAQLYKDSYGIVHTRYAGAIAMIPTDSENPLVYSVALPPYTSRNRNVRAFNWLFDDGAVGVALIPFGSSADSGMVNNSTKNVTLTAYITATGDFTTTSSQILNDSEGL